MLKKIIISGALLNVLIVIGLGYYCMSPKENKVSSSSIKKRIALFEPVIHAAIQEIEEGFITQIKSMMPDTECVIYNAAGNKTLLRAQAEELISAKYDLIFTIGALCTQTVKELCVKRNVNTPVVFSSVDEPVEMGLINNLTSSGNNLTGVMESPDYEQQLALLFKLKPATKKVLIAYDPAHGTGKLQKDVQAVTQLLEKYGASATTVEISHANELQQKISAFLSDADVLFIFKDNTVVSGIEGLVKLCNHYGVTLYASDLNSGIKGAAIAYGITERESGIQAAQKAYVILHDHKAPTDIPLTLLKNMIMMINKETMQQQQLAIDSQLLFLLENVRVK